MTALALVGVLALGGAGAVLRFLVDGAVSRRTSSSLPVGTYAVNVSGAVVLGFVEALALPSEVALVVGTGMIGAYTTFSTWMFETQRLVEERQLGPALWNILGSVVTGVAAAALGMWVGGLV